MMINKIIPKNTNKISISYPQWSHHCRRRDLARAQVYCNCDTIWAQGSREHTTISQRDDVVTTQDNNWDKSEVALDFLK